MVIKLSNIYGIAGRKGHGKDTFARVVKQHNSSYKIIHFADKMKQMICDIFPIHEIQLNDPQLKEKSITPIIMDDYIDKMKKATNLNIIPRNKIANSPRDLMQCFGTDYVKSIDSYYWIRIVEAFIKAHQEKILIPDCRFHDEVEMLRSLNSKLIKVMRIDLKPEDNSHKSEVSVDTIDVDLTLGILKDEFDLYNKIAQLIAINEFDKAINYDYSIVQEIIYKYKQGILIRDISREMKYIHPMVINSILRYYKVI